MINDTNSSLPADARRALDHATWAYLVGGAGTEATLRRNRAAFDRLAFRPRVLRDVHEIDVSTDVFGTTMRIPVLLAPIGNLEVFHEDGPDEITRAAADFGVMHVVAGVGPIPGIMTGAGPKAYQIYMDGDHQWLSERVGRAASLGYRSIVLTVDVPRRARRERQALAGYRFTGTGPSRDRLARTTWTDVEFLRSQTDLPLVLKGIQTGADAEIASSVGVDGIWVSNHGGRQLDHGRSSLESLREIADTLDGAGTLVVDGGVMTGSDVLKAISLGADLVAIGRLQCLALAAGGSERVRTMLAVLEDEMASQMGMLGAVSLDGLTADAIAESLPSGSPDPMDPWSYLR